ncbi:uncharacterized protein LAESUDRAFT_403523 [Laetiporus sulphureus 93-53]|uniref:Uncharacterized protein n=1 Tax=Laetiporus sulphureus 93-53 TaxID=1314785 RepID=A0A165CCR4_9APHY|nr:uncharacterized protein LAESUDRAFT_403523 [Laetiporus sulphureus 93-53]KZT02574.1 hypothetical protein LAESUDRAFT_403523 [Laetiporus sulphureus 93-53]
MSGSGDGSGSIFSATHHGVSIYSSVIDHLWRYDTELLVFEHILLTSLVRRTGHMRIHSHHLTGMGLLSSGKNAMLVQMPVTPRILKSVFFRISSCLPAPKKRPCQREVWGSYKPILLRPSQKKEVLKPQHGLPCTMRFYYRVCSLRSVSRGERGTRCCQLNRGTCFCVRNPHSWHRIRVRNKMV